MLSADDLTPQQVARRKPWEANGPGQRLIGWVIVAVALVLQAAAGAFRGRRGR